MPPEARAEWEIALSAHHGVLAFLHSPQSQVYLRRWIKHRDTKYGREASQPSQVAGAHLLADVKSADTIYITKEMQQVVYRASESFKKREPVWLDDFFIQNGFAYLAEPFTTIDISGRKLCWRAISWKTDSMWTIDPHDKESMDMLKKRFPMVDDPLNTAYQFSAKDMQDVPSAKEEYVVRIAMWAHKDDEDDFSMEGATHDWLVTHMTAIPFSAIPDQVELHGDGDKDASWLVFLRVLNRIMAEKLISKERRPISRQMRRLLLRKNVPISDVVVVELRRRQQRHEHDGEGEHREFSHRFIRHGHWRNQWYPSIRRHRQKWIEDMVIGPEDKPLILKDRIWNFDR